jgi:hypothetical protein
MNEIDELLKMDVKDLPPLRPMLLDDLYHNSLKNLHLEMGAGSILFLISPSFSVMTPEPNESVTELITKKETLLNYLKEHIIQSLAVYSVILDMSSYFIEQNDHLVLARLRERDSEGRRYEIKFYTHSPKELLSRYEDKIYIGRDFVDLYSFNRKYLGVKEHIISLKGQYERLLESARLRMKNTSEYRSFFQEINESVGELQTESLLILQSLPPQVDLGKLSGKDLIEINAQYRMINHFLIELHDEVDEFENRLRQKKENDFVRYVTKYKRDLTNLISYFNIKINGTFTSRIYNFKAKHS